MFSSEVVSVFNELCQTKLQFKAFPTLFYWKKKINVQTKLIMQEIFTANHQPKILNHLALLSAAPLLTFLVSQTMGLSLNYSTSRPLDRGSPDSLHSPEICRLHTVPLTH